MNAKETPADATLVRLEYFAAMRGHARKAGEEGSTLSATVGDLYAELADIYALPFHASQLHVAVNDEFADWDRPLREDDRGAFLTPMSGG